MAYKEQRQLDVYHRAFKELRRETLPHETSRKHRASLHKNNQQKERLETVRFKFYFKKNA